MTPHWLFLLTEHESETGDPLYAEFISCNRPHGVSRKDRRDPPIEVSRQNHSTEESPIDLERT